MSLDDNLEGNQISHDAVVDLKKLQKFRKGHEAHVEKKSPDPSGHDYKVMYIPTSVGTIVKVLCPCGKERDVTDYDSF